MVVYISDLLSKRNARFQTTFSKMFTEHTALEDREVSPSRAEQVRFLTRIMRIMSPSGAKVEQAC